MHVVERYEQTVARGESVERPTFFSDAVFAIAMTLLVIELHVPDVPAGELPVALQEMLPEYLTFMLSFVVIGAAWMSHHRKFRMIARHDQNLLRLNLLMLLVVASIPFPTALLGHYGDTLAAVVIYAAVIATSGLLMTSVWVYAWRRGLTAPALERDVFRFMLLQSVAVPIVFLLSIPVAVLFGPTAGELSWIAAFPATILAGRLAARRPAQKGSR